jgi:hypothetical protein
MLLDVMDMGGGLVLLRAACLAAVVCCAGGGAFAQSGMPNFPTNLRSSGETHLPLSSNFMADGQSQCDSRGNIYLRPIYSRVNDSSGVVRIDPTNGTTTGYPFPKDFGPSRAIFGFSVTRSGKVWALVEQEDETYIAARWNENGEVDARVVLRPPLHMFALTFAVADDGIILVGGIFSEQAEKKLQGQEFLAVFDQTGNVRNVVEAKELETHDISSGVLGEFDMGATAATDGNFYVLQHGRVLVVSEWGALVRQIKFDSIVDNTARAIRYGDGLLSLELDNVDKQHQVHPQWLVLYAGTGDVYGWYRLAEDLKGLPECFLGRAGYSFMASEDKKMKILNVPLR